MATTRQSSTKSARPQSATTATKRVPPRKPTGTTKAKPKRKPLPTYKAPADFRAHFLLVTIRTEADGLFGCRGLKAVRYQGRFDREAEDKKKFDLGSYDPMTLAGILGRLSGRTFKSTNDKKYPADAKARNGLKGAHRLPASRSSRAGSSRTSRS